MTALHLYAEFAYNHLCSIDSCRLRDSPGLEMSSRLHQDVRRWASNGLRFLLAVCLLLPAPAVGQCSCGASCTSCQPGTEPSNNCPFCAPNPLADGCCVSEGDASSGGCCCCTDGPEEPAADPTRADENRGEFVTSDRDDGSCQCRCPCRHNVDVRSGIAAATRYTDKSKTVATGRITAFSLVMLQHLKLANWQRGSQDISPHTSPENAALLCRWLE